MSVSLKSLSLKKLTWFTKGLRRHIVLVGWFYPRKKETDLIYEGIATKVGCLFSDLLNEKKLTWFTKGLRRGMLCAINNHLIPQRNWPDLRRDCDLLPHFPVVLISLVKETDLIYEGIATFLKHFLNTSACPFLKKLTWFTKGLRPIFFNAACFSSRVSSQRNWPDLRRDCDWSPLLPLWLLQPIERNWPDLRRDCDG